MSKACVAVLAVVVMFLSPCASAAVRAQQLELKAGPIAVSVKNHDGKPLADAEIRINGSGDKLVGTVKTDAAGKCVIKDLACGSYELVVADRATLPFDLTEKGKASTVLIVLPAPANYAAGGTEKAGNRPVLVAIIVGVIAVAGVIGVISATGILASDSGCP